MKVRPSRSWMSARFIIYWMTSRLKKWYPGDLLAGVVDPGQDQGMFLSRSMLVTYPEESKVERMWDSYIEIHWQGVHEIVGEEGLRYHSIQDVQVPTLVCSERDYVKPCPPSFRELLCWWATRLPWQEIITLSVLAMTSLLFSQNKVVSWRTKSPVCDGVGWSHLAWSDSHCYFRPEGVSNNENVYQETIPDYVLKPWAKDHFLNEPWTLQKYLLHLVNQDHSSLVSGAVPGLHLDGGTFALLALSQAYELHAPTIDLRRASDIISSNCILTICYAFKQNLVKDIYIFMNYSDKRPSILQTHASKWVTGLLLVTLYTLHVAVELVAGISVLGHCIDLGAAPSIFLAIFTSIECVRWRGLQALCTLSESRFLGMHTVFVVDTETDMQEQLVREGKRMLVVC